MSKKSPSIIGVVVKATHPRALELTSTLLGWLGSRGVDIRLDTEIAAQFSAGAPAPAKFTPIERSRVTSECEKIIVLGGDGTLISVCRHPSPLSPVIVGVNLGTLGFLTEVTLEELYSVLDSALSDKAVLEKRYLLQVGISRSGGGTEQFFAFNDIVLTKPALARIFGTEFFVDDQFAAAVHGDGLIIATPAGSTAYSLAAGGSIVHPQVNALLVTPICPHSLTSRPLVIPGSSTVRLRLASASKDEEVLLTFDGQQGTEIAFGDEIRVITSERYVRFARYPLRSYFQILATKLKWASA